MLSLLASTELLEKKESELETKEMLYPTFSAKKPGSWEVSTLLISFPVDRLADAWPCNHTAGWEENGAQTFLHCRTLISTASGFFCDRASQYSPGCPRMCSVDDHTVQTNTLCIQSCCVDQADLQCTEIGLPLPPGCLDYSCAPLLPTHFWSSPTTVMTPTGQPACRVTLGPVLCSTLSQTQLMLRTRHFGGIIMMFFVQEKKLRHRGQRNAHGVSVKSYQQLGWRIVPGICVLPGLHALRSVCSWVCVLPSFLTAALLCLPDFLMTFISTG